MTSMLELKIVSVILFVMAYGYLGWNMYHFLEGKVHRRWIGGLLWPITFCWLIIDANREDT